MFTTRRALIAVVWITVAEGLAALVLMFRVPSMERNAWILGFSIRRLALSGALFVAVTALTVLAVRISRYARWFDAALAKVVSFLSVDNRYINMASAFAFISLLGVASLIFFSSSILAKGNSYRVIYERAKPVVFWVTLTSVQACSALFIGRSTLIGEKRLQNRKILGRNLLLMLLSIAALAQWAILFFRLEVLTQIPNWYWLFQPRSGLRSWLLVPITLGSMLFAHQILRPSTPFWRKAVLLVVLGYAIQVGFGYVEGEGFKTLQARYVERGRPYYSYIVTDRDFSLMSVIEYEEVYGNDYFLGRRPPGYLLVHAITSILANPEPLSSTQGDRFERVTTVMAYTYPLLAMAIVPVLLAIGSQLLPGRGPAVPCLLFLFFPNFILMTLQLDQVLFPMLFMVGLYLTLRVVERESSSLTIIQGAYLFIAVYFSFTLLPLLALVPVLTMLTFITHRRKEWARRFGRTAIGWALGFGASYLGFRLIAGYDLVSRLVNGFTVHAENAGFPSGLRGSLHAIELDTAEIAIWIGFPTVILLLIQAFGSIIAMFRKSHSMIDPLMVAVLLTLPLIARFAPAGGEVARVGLFFMPVVSFFVVKSLDSMMPESNLPVYSFVCYQLISVLLILQNQFPWQ